jgi:hypothetical protein
LTESKYQTDVTQTQDGIRCVEHAAQMEEMRNAYKIVRRPEGKRPLDRKIISE